MPLFEVALLEKPTAKQVAEGTGKERLVFGPKAVVAPSKEAAGIVAVKAADAPSELDMDRVEVLVRPFA